MIVYHPNGEIMATGSKIDIVDAQGETNLIRVYPDEGDGFYFIGTNDRHEYVIADVALPADYASGKYTFDGTAFTAKA